MKNKKVSLILACTLFLGTGALVFAASKSSYSPVMANASNGNILYNGDFSKGNQNWTGIKEINEDDNGKYATTRASATEVKNLSNTDILPNAEYNMSFKYKILSYTSGDGFSPYLCFDISSDRGSYVDYCFDENTGHFMRDKTISSDWITTSFNFRALNYDLIIEYGFLTGGTVVQIRDCALTYVNQTANVIGTGKHGDTDYCKVYGGGTFEYGNQVIGGKGYEENYGLGICSENRTTGASLIIAEGHNSIGGLKATNVTDFEWKIGKASLLESGELYGTILKANVTYVVSFDFRLTRVNPSDNTELMFRSVFQYDTGGFNQPGNEHYEFNCSYMMDSVNYGEWQTATREWINGNDCYLNSMVWRSKVATNVEIDNIVIREKVTSYEEDFASYFLEKITYDCTSEQSDIEPKWQLCRDRFNTYPVATQNNLKNIIADKDAPEGSIEKALYRYDRAVSDLGMFNFIQRPVILY